MKRCAKLCLVNTAWAMFLGERWAISPYHLFLIENLTTVVSITKQWSACGPLITQLFLFFFLFCIPFLSFFFYFLLIIFFFLSSSFFFISTFVAKLRFSMHEGSANTYSRTMAADAKLQKCMRRARGLQQRIQQQQQQEQPQEPGHPQGPCRYLHCLLLMCVRLIACPKILSRLPSVCLCFRLRNRCQRF